MPKNVLIKISLEELEGDPKEFVQQKGRESSCKFVMSLSSDQFTDPENNRNLMQMVKRGISRAIAADSKEIKSVVLALEVQL